MPSIKKSVMLSEQAQRYIDTRGYTKGGGEDYAWSEAVNETFKAAQWVAESSLPELSQAEWQHILNAHSGVIIDYTPPYRLASDLMDNVGAVSLEELDPDYAALVRKLHSMSQAAQFAVLDFTRKFWARAWSGDWDSIYAAITGKRK